MPKAAYELSPTHQIKRRYKWYLRDECGVSPNTIEAFLSIVHIYLQHSFDTNPIQLEHLCVSDMYRYIRLCCENCRWTTKKLHTAALWSFFTICIDVAEYRLMSAVAFQQFDLIV